MATKGWRLVGGTLACALVGHHGCENGGLKAKVFSGATELGLMEFDMLVVPVATVYGLGR